MGFRDRVKKTFKKKDGSASVSGGSTPSTGSEIHYTGRTDIQYYKPNEIPKSKYRGKVDPEHKERLESYSFADAFTAVRRKSSQALSGIMSPGQSRRPSAVSHMSKASKDVRTPAHEPAINPMSRRGTIAEPRPANIRENSDDDTNPMNTGLAKQPMANQNRASNVPEVKLERQATNPFSAEELEQAMSRTTLQHGENISAPRSMAIAAH